MKKEKIIGLTVKYLFPVIIVFAGIMISVQLIKSKPKSKRRPPQRQPRLVETVLVQPQDVTITVRAMGPVVPARQVQLTPQVSGKIIELDPNLVPGVIVSKGSELLKIEPADYELTLKQRQSERANAKSNLDIEQGSQEVARHESSLLGDLVTESDRMLVLRQPQLVIAKSLLEMAEAKVDQAKLDLERTVVKAPFNAVINAKNVDLGQVVSPSTPLLKLTGTDEFWAEVSVPVDKLKWINIPGKNSTEGSYVKVYNTPAWGKDVYREGKVLRLLPDLETAGRMAKLLVSIKDPLLAGSSEEVKNFVLLGSFVHVEIKGRLIESVYSIDRSLLRDGNNLWLLNNQGGQNRLHIKPVDILYKGANEVIVSKGINAGDMIVSTELSAPVTGMLLRTSKQQHDIAGKDSMAEKEKNKPGTGSYKPAGFTPESK